MVVFVFFEIDCTFTYEEHVYSAPVSLGLLIIPQYSEFILQYRYIKNMTLSQHDQFIVVKWRVMR